MSDAGDDAKPFIIRAREAMERAEACETESERMLHLEMAIHFLKLASDSSAARG